jgi:WD40 repeat protein
MSSQGLQFLTFTFLILFGSTNPVAGDTSIKYRLNMGAGFGVWAVAFCCDGGILAVACGPNDGPGEIRLYSVEEGKLIGTLKGHDDRVNCQERRRAGFAKRHV